MGWWKKWKLLYYLRLRFEFSREPTTGAQCQLIKEEEYSMELLQLIVITAIGAMKESTTTAINTSKSDFEIGTPN